MDREEISYLMLFCGLLVINRSGTKLDELILVLPLVGKAKSLASELVNWDQDAAGIHR